MKNDLHISTDIIIRAAELNFSFSRASGPGGQNVNKVNSKATLRWNIYATKALPWSVKDRFIKAYKNKITEEGDFLVSSSDTRDQIQNIDLCLQRLGEAIKRVLTPPKKRVKTKPSRSSKEKRIQGKKLHAKKKSMRKMQD